MSRFDLPASRRAAAALLGRGGGRALDKLKEAGLVVVFRSELPILRQGTRTLLDVDVSVSDDWALPWPCTVITGERIGGEIFELFVQADAVSSVKEVRLLREVMGGKINVEIDEGEGLLLRAWRDE